MKGDFTRDTFQPEKHFSRVLLQQGRVQLDSDFNEQVSIFLHYLQGFAADLIGPHGGPCQGCAFGFIVSGGQLKISKGRYYVDGIMCELDADILYSDYAKDDDDLLKGLNGPTFYYLDVWEQFVTYHQDTSLREVALLNGADTAARTQVNWRIKTRTTRSEEMDKALGSPDNDSLWTKVWEQLEQPPNRGNLRARCHVTKPDDDEDYCIVPPDSHYRGAENQLYRVEVHNGGEAGTATFKWSRDNGSIVFPIRNMNGSNTVFLEHLGRDNSRQGLKVGDWVEIVDDRSELSGPNQTPRPLSQVSVIDQHSRMVRLSSPETSSALEVPANSQRETPLRHPLLRRWDHVIATTDKDGTKYCNGAIVITESSDVDKAWFSLENGISIQFDTAKPDEDGTLVPHKYRQGDYWLIPARTATGDIEWPQEHVNGTSTGKAISPHGVTHHYAPLAWIENETSDPVDLRRFFKSSAMMDESKTCTNRAEAAVAKKATASERKRPSTKSG